MTEEQDMQGATYPTHQNLRTSDKTDKIFPAFFAAWAKVEAALKDSLNPAFKSHYANLTSCMEAVKGPMIEAGLFQLQPATVYDNVVSVETIVIHGVSGQWISNLFALRAIDTKPQSIGSTASYARRYGMGALWSLISDEDDDGNKASGTPAPIQRIDAKKTTPAPRSEPVTPAPVGEDPKTLRQSLIEAGVDKTALATFWQVYHGGKTVQPAEYAASMKLVSNRIESNPSAKSAAVASFNLDPKEWANDFLSKSTATA